MHPLYPKLVKKFEMKHVMLKDNIIQVVT